MPCKVIRKQHAPRLSRYWEYTMFFWGSLKQDLPNTSRRPIMDYGTTIHRRKGFQDRVRGGRHASDWVYGWSWSITRIVENIIEVASYCLLRSIKIFLKAK